MGVAEKAFYIVCFMAIFLFVMRLYWAIPLCLPVVWIARWMTKRDAQFMEVFMRYTKEKAVFDPWFNRDTMKSRPERFGRELPC